MGASLMSPARTDPWPTPEAERFIARLAALGRSSYRSPEVYEFKELLNSATPEQCQALNTAEIQLYEELALGETAPKSQAVEALRSLSGKHMRALIAAQRSVDNPPEAPELRVARDGLYRFSFKAPDDDLEE
jgi:hypothetical protein